MSQSIVNSNIEKEWGQVSFASQFTNQTPSKSWYLFPATCLSIVITSLIVLTDIEFSASVDWSDQSELFYALNDLLTIAPHALWDNLTQLGDVVVLIPLLSLLLIKKPQTWLSIVYSAPIAGIICTTLKRTIEAPRPGAILDSNNFVQIGEILNGLNSFPSGHTTTIFVVTVAILCASFPNPSNPIQKVVITIGITFAALVALSRVAVGAHWPLDIVFGAGIGAASAIAGTYLSKRISSKWTQGRTVLWLTLTLPGLLSFVLLYRVIFLGEYNVVVLIAMSFGLVSTGVLIKKHLARLKES